MRALRLLATLSVGAFAATGLSLAAVEAIVRGLRGRGRSVPSEP